ncbi:hypothetical protein [Salinibacillus xinjiangensis]|uniref:hypothetical protein n=1 Tax=Salinibacillus xinjiangensis TaxID=1229268 RepID=UPI00129A5713|nr:hypothetical protein [Salinibacillus xinjiangensis]
MARKWTRTYAPFIIFTPIIGIAFYTMLHYPFTLSILLAIFLSLRFIHLVKEGPKENEKTLILITFYIAIIEALIFSTNSVIWIAMLQFFLVLISYYAKHYSSLKQQSSENHFSYIGVPVPVIVTSIFLFLSGAMYMFFEEIQSLLHGLWGIMVIVLSAVFKVIGVGVELTGITEFKLDSSQSSTEKLQIKNVPKGDYNFLGDSTVSAINNSMNVLAWVGYGFIALVMIWIVVKYFKKNIHEVDQKQASKHITFQKIHNNDVERKKSITQWFSRHPKHVARKLIFQFEEFSIKKGHGRKYYETIEEWFNRLNLELGDITLYQKVRYGEEEITKEELARLRLELSQLRKEIQNRQKNEG